MSESSNMLFVTVFGKADALGDLTTTNAVTKTLAAAGLAVGFAAATAVAEGDRSSAIHGRDDRRACGRRIYNQLAHQPYVVRLSLWADAGLSIVLHDVRRDVWCRRFFVWQLIVWAGESLRSWTLMIKTDRLGSYRSRTAPS
jgi:hypothetical protein